MLDQKGKNLIFLISQPRAGSTLLQRMLGSNSEIHTVSEPWLMLHPLYALRDEGYRAEYDEKLAWRARKDFFQDLPAKDAEYIEGVRRMYLYLYSRSLSVSDKRCFLDKTPRYYFIIPELLQTFTKAYYIILLRNPLAVLCSIINSWTNEQWFRLYNFRHDLIDAPKLLVKGIKILGEQGICVNYEQMLKEPQIEMKRICKRLHVQFAPEMIEYGSYNLPYFQFGDKDEVYQRTHPMEQNAGKWELSLHNPQIWRLCNDYCQLLGRKTIEQMGYSFEEQQQLLAAYKPSQYQFFYTFPLIWLLKKPVKDRNKWERYTSMLKILLQKKELSRSTFVRLKKFVNVLRKPY
jgi:hypothetical protein